MTPETHRIVSFDLPILFIDEKATSSVLNFEARRSSNIKRRHHVVGVTAEAHCERQFLIVDDVEGSADVGEWTRPPDRP